MVAGFLGAEAPKRREKDRLGRGEGKEELLRTVVPFLPHKTLLTLQFIAKQIKRVLGAKPLKEHYRRQFIAKQIKDRPLEQKTLLKYSQLHTSMLP